MIVVISMKLGRIMVKIKYILCKNNWIVVVISSNNYLGAIVHRLQRGNINSKLKRKGYLVTQWKNISFIHF